ncbi:hypothetical protein LXA43DRAFT_756158 [Ganoderma leucocontextum]|nr:hypothetical protein LXA43DRAFT_756158 [Ganoderma leucocontextum]
MAIQTRSFIVFKDEPEDTPVQVVTLKPSNEDGVLNVLASPIKTTNPSTLTAPASAGPLLVFCPDKENIDPLTGGRVLSEQSLGKKRKTALIVKAQPASPSKKPRPLAEKPTKKPSTSKSKPRSSTEKKLKRSTSTSSKRSSSSRTRREPSLPRLAEEGEESTEAAPLDQAAIDAKCKELTVLPLADISEAYEQATTKEDAVESAEKAAEVKAAVDAASKKVDRPATPPPTTQKEDAATSPVAPMSVASVFSTPERKRIYSAFTFSSPSPASKRFASTRGSSVERFSDVAF